MIFSAAAQLLNQRNSAILLSAQQRSSSISAVVARSDPSAPTPTPTPSPSSTPAPTPGPSSTPSPTPSPSPSRDRDRTPTATPAPAPAGSVGTTGPDCPARWKQCGGQKFEGQQGCCQEGNICKFSNQWYSQCLPGVFLASPITAALFAHVLCNPIQTGAQ